MTYSDEAFRITMVTELRDGTSRAVTVRVTTAALQSSGEDQAATDELEEHQDVLNDNVITAFWRLVKLWETTPRGPDNG